jgi:hypothetical protein
MADERSLRVGVGKSDITPPVGIELTGYVARRGKSRGIRDRLFSKALLLEQGDKRILLIANDLLSIGKDLSRRIKSLIEKKLGFASKDVVITATHTHSGPATVELRGCGRIDAGYLTRLPRKILFAASKAMENIVPVRTEFGQFAVELGENRRQKGGYVDHTGGIICFISEIGRTVACILNYNCHPVVLTHNNLSISADYPGVTTQTIEKSLGGICLFLAGAVGDVDPRHRGSYEFVEEMGKAIASAAMGSAKQRKQLGGKLELLSRTIQVPGEEILPENIEKELEILKKASDPSSILNALYIEDKVSLHWLGKKIAKVYLRWYDETKRLKAHGVTRLIHEVEIRMLRIGHFVLVFLPGEPHAIVGKKIKNALSPNPVLVAGYAEDYLGYIPNEETYELGGYEIYQANRFYGMPAVLGRGTDSMIVQALREMV